MKGSVCLYVKEGKLEYDFILGDKITIVSDNSGTGKSTLVRILDNYISDIFNGGYSDTIVECDGYRVLILDTNNWELFKLDFQRYKNCIFVLDNFNRFIKDNAFAEFVTNTNSYFLIITREHLPKLHYNANNVYQLHTIGNTHFLKKMFPH